LTTAGRINNTISRPAPAFLPHFHGRFNMTRRLAWLLLLLAALLTLAPLAATACAVAPDDHWKGSIDLPGGQSL